MRFGSLFSGIGGFDLGFERAGMTCSWQVEIDDYATKVLEKHWPHVTRYRDVRECGKHNLTTVDVIVGGFPCQPHSLAGKRQGASDDRDLWPEYRRIVAELRPRWIVGENVPGIRTTILDQVLSDLESLDYATGTLVIPACAFDAPHIRERVLIIAHADSIGQQAQVQLSEKSKFSRSGATVANAKHHKVLLDQQHNKTHKNPARPGQWSLEPGVCGVAHGVPHRVDRLRTLGNAVVPQMAEWIGRRIMEIGL